MIVVDESIHSFHTLRAIADWYPGTVLSIVQLRLSTIVKDDGVPMLLQQANEPTFVTVNVDDFWLKINAHRRYCVVAVVLPQEQSRQIPGLLRRLLRLAEFRTKAQRMGKVIRVRSSAIEYYASDR